MTVRRLLSRSTLLAALLALVSACGSTGDTLAERVLEAATGDDVEIDIDSDGDGDENVEIATDDGTVRIGGGTVPDEWPGDVPLPSGFEVATSSSFSNDDGQYAAVIGNADMTPDEVHDFFASALTDWEESSRMSVNVDGGDIQTVSYEQRGRHLVVSTNDAPDAELISVTYQSEESGS